MEALSSVELRGQGCSCPGVWMNLDWMAERYPQARVVGAPIAGFYFYAFPYDGPGHTQSDLADFRPAAWPSYVHAPSQ